MAGSRKGKPNKITAAVKDAVEHAFTKVNGEGYLIWLSKAHPQAFCSLVAKCIPSAVAIDVTHTLDLGAALIEADKRIKQAAQLEAGDDAKLIDAVVIEEATR